ncbi:hypothetical protein GC170_12310 [bacterium]|nr:hypothetical protein [bacterium]
MKPAYGSDRRPPLPARAKWIFAVTAVLVSACFVARRPGTNLHSWQKWLLDAPMLAMVALSSLILATWRRDLPMPVENTRDESKIHEQERIDACEQA